jgi:hypothetical protein
MTKNIAEMAAEIRRLVELTTPRQRDLRIALHSVADRLEAAAQQRAPVAGPGTPITSTEALHIWHNDHAAHELMVGFEMYAAGIIAGERHHGIKDAQ